MPESSETPGPPRFNVVSLAIGALVLALLVAGVFWLNRSRPVPAPRKVMQFTRVNLAPPPPAPKPVTPPPQQVVQPKVEETPQLKRVEMKEFVPPEAPRPSAEPPSGGRLALATEGEGPGDAFNLVGNPGGSSLTSGGSLGDGTGTGLGEDDNARRFGWYYAHIAAEIEDVFRKQKRLSMASTRVELRVWADESGLIERVQLIHSTGRAELDEAIQSVVGHRLKEPPPRDIPMPLIARFIARRPQ